MTKWAGDHISELIAGVSLLLAGWVAVRDWKRGKEQDRLAREQLQLSTRLGAIEEEKRNEELAERSRAVLSSRLVSRPVTTSRNYTYHWVISNDGLADAHNVDFKATSTSQKATGKLAYRRDQQFPIRLISAKRKFEFTALPSQEFPPFDVLLTWSDGAGEHTKDQHVSLESDS